MNELILVLTTRCNQHCAFCCEPPSVPDMTLGTALAFLDSARSASIPWVDLSGGEPLLHRDTEALARRSRAIGLRVTLSTNGQLLRSRMDALFPFVDQWNLSLHGTSAIHDSIVHRKGSHSSVLDACRALADARAIVHITYVVTPSNLGSVRATVDELVSAGVTKICFNYVFPRGRGGAYSADRPQTLHDAARSVDAQLADLPGLPLTLYHNLNLPGQCILARPNGDLWGVPMSENARDYELLGTVDDLLALASKYRYAPHHLKFTLPRLGAVPLSTVKFDMEPVAC